MAFQFGAPNQTTTQPGTGFTLSQPQQQQTRPFNYVAPASSAFNFGTSSTSSPGFAFGAPATTTTSTGLGFGTPASTPATQGFSFGTPAAAPGGGFSFGQTATTTASSTGFGFGQQASATTAATTTTTTTAPTSGFLFGTANTSAGGSSAFNFNPGAPAPATTTTSTVFSFTPSSTFGGFGTPTTTSGSASMFGFGTGNAPSATTTAAGFSLVSSQPSNTSSAFNFGTPKTSAQVIAPAFGLATPSSSASATTVASSTTGALPFGAPSFGTTTFAFGPKPAVTTASTGFTFNTPATTAGMSLFPTLQMTSASVLNPPGPFNQGTSTAANMIGGGGSTNSALGANLVSASTGSGGFALNVPSVTSSFGTTQPATGTSVNFTTSEAPKTAAFAFPLLTSVSSSGTSGFGTTMGTTSATVVKPTLNFTGPTTSVAAAVSSIPASSQADQAKVPSLTTTAPTSVSSVISSGFSFPSSTTSVTTSSTGFPTQGSSLKIAATTSGPSLLSTTIPFASSGGTFGSFGTTTSVSLSTATTVTASSAAGAALTTTTTVTPASAAPPPTMNFRQLEDTINKWKIELEEQERVFLNQATQVNAWDRLLISNGEKITELNDAVERVKLDQQRLDHELDFILAQQRELEELLVPLEKSVEATPNIHHQQHADLEREHTYHLAENIDAQLKRMAEDIKEIIEHLNSSNKTQDDNDPIQQIAKILNAHMDALQWVDQNTAVLRRKLDETSKLYESHRRDHEKSFRVGFS